MFTLYIPGKIKKTHTELPAEKGKAVDLNEITQACSLADIVAEHSVAGVQ